MFLVQFQLQFIEKSLNPFLEQFFNWVYTPYYLFKVYLAQLVEHWIVAPEVAGSSPSLHPLL